MPRSLRSIRHWGCDLVGRTGRRPARVPLQPSVRDCRVAHLRPGGRTGQHPVPAASGPRRDRRGQPGRHRQRMAGSVPAGRWSLKRPGAEFWSVVVGSDGTVFALAVEPEPGDTSSASILAIAPDSTVLSITTILEP